MQIAAAGESAECPTAELENLPRLKYLPPTQPGRTPPLCTLDIRDVSAGGRVGGRAPAFGSRDTQSVCSRFCLSAVS